MWKRAFFKESFLFFPEKQFHGKIGRWERFCAISTLWHSKWKITYLRSHPSLGKNIVNATFLQKELHWFHEFLVYPVIQYPDCGDMRKDQIISEISWKQLFNTQCGKVRKNAITILSKEICTLKFLRQIE